MKYHIGIATDIHNLKRSFRPSTITLGGYKFCSKYKVVAHSDGDLVFHAISNAILGAIGLRDIGFYFSDKDSLNKNITSEKILLFALKKLKEKGYKLVNLDLMIICQKIMINQYYEKILASIQKYTNVKEIGLKATRFERKSCQIQCNCAVLISKN